MICDEAENTFQINNKPAYLNEQLFFTTDAKGKKPLDQTPTAGMKFWKKWGAVK